MTCDTNCPYRTLNRCTVTGRARLSNHEAMKND